MLAAASKWVADAGEYTLQIGASSIDIRATANFQKLRQVALSP
jgi:hypothetical protein